MAFPSCSSFPNSFRLSISQNKTPKIHNTSAFVIRSDLINKPPLISVPQKWAIAKDINLLPCNNILSKHPCSADLSVYKDVVSKVGEDPSEGLKIVDAIQRLGIDYIFQDEIEGILQKQYMLFSDRYRARASEHDHVDDLREIALRFRLLRQQGYFVPAGWNYDVFNNFKDNNGVFSEKLNENIYGLIELYEATQLSVEGDYVLEEAELFSGQLLNASLTCLDNVRTRFVANALENPCHKSLAKFTAKSLFGGTHQSVNEWINVLQGLAKVEFNKGQSLHKKEIVQISQWWRDLGLAKELRFARDQPLKWYIWSMACLTDPSLSQHRVELTKPISFIYIIDDIFDVYGTLDQLTLFTDSINRWDMASAEKLPDYMKICFKALDNLTNEISYKVYQNHGWNPLHSLRNTWANLCNAFLVEARWFAMGHVPSTEEYLRNGVVSSGVHVVLVHIFYLLGKGLTQETSKFVDNMPGIVTSTAAILRLWDDLGSAEDENQEGHDGSYVDCYIKERQGSSVEEAREHIRNKISKAWKCLNKECLFAQNNNNNNIQLPATFLKASLNLARLVPLMYSYDDNQRLPSLEEHVKSMLYESAHV